MTRARWATAAAPTTSRTAGRRRGSGRARSCCIPTGESYAPASELGAEMLELVRPAARRLGSERFLDLLDPNGCEADLQLQFDTAQEAAADIVARSLG